MAHSFPSVAAHTSSSTTISRSGCITNEDVNLLKFMMAIRKGGPVAKSFVIVFERCSTFVSSETIEHFCVCYYQQNTTNKTPFKKNDLDALRTSDPKDLDITMLHKLLLHVCSLPNDLVETKLNALKKQRNFLVHKAVQVTDNDLSNRFFEIQNDLRTLLIAVKVESTVINDILAELNDIRVSPAVKANALDLISQRKAIKEDIEKDIIEDCCKELRSSYSQMRVMTPITWREHSSFHNITVDKVFTDLTIFETTKRVAIKDILKVEREAGEPSNRVLVTGVSGAGKTSLCKYLVYCWAEGQVDRVEGLDEVKLVIFIQCRFVHSDNLRSYLREDILHASLHFLEDPEVIALLQRINPVFLVDGYEEANEKTKSVIEEIHHLFTRAKIIISSRPHILEDLRAKLAFDGPQEHRTLTLQIEGLDKNSEVEFARKLFEVLEVPSTGNSRADLFISQMKSDKWNKLQPILKLPLTLALLIFLWVDDKSRIEDISTEAQIHFKIIEMTKKRLENHLTGKGSKEELNSKVNSFCDELGKVALDAITDGKPMSLDTGTVRMLEDKFLNLADKMMSSVLACEIKETLTTTEKVWSFVHAAQLEVLAAMHVKEQTIIDDKFSFWKVLSKSPGCDSQYSSELMRNVILRSMEFLASSERLLPEVVVAVVKGFPANSEQNLGFIGDLLNLADQINAEVIVQSLKDHLDVSHLPRWISCTLVPIITELLKRGIIPSQTKISFHVVDHEYENFVRDLNKFQCTPMLLIDVSLEDQLTKLVDFIKNNKKGLSVQIVMEFHRWCKMEVLRDLEKEWDWSEPMRICCHTYNQDQLEALFRIIGLRLAKIVCDGLGDGKVIENLGIIAKRNDIEFKEIAAQDDRLVISFHSR